VNTAQTPASGTVPDAGASTFVDLQGLGGQATPVERRLDVPESALGELVDARRVVDRDRKRAGEGFGVARRHE
jgi:hypothetical protein